MIHVLVDFCKGGRQYKKGDEVSFLEHDEKRLVRDNFAEYPKIKRKYKKK